MMFAAALCKKKDKNMSDLPKEKGLLLVTMDIDPEHEAEFNRWYEEEHLPERKTCPGFISARRFVSVEGGPKYLALYDLESVDVLQSEAYLRIAGPSERTARLRPLFKNYKRNIYREI